jgi:hypothetical protein
MAFPLVVVILPGASHATGDGPRLGGEGRVFFIPGVAGSRFEERGNMSISQVNVCLIVDALAT